MGTICEANYKLAPLQTTFCPSVILLHMPKGVIGTRGWIHPWVLRMVSHTILLYLFPASHTGGVMDGKLLKPILNQSLPPVSSLIYSFSMKLARCKIWSLPTPISLCFVYLLKIYAAYSFNYLHFFKIVNIVSFNAKESKSKLPDQHQLLSWT